MDFAQLEYFISVAKTQNMHVSSENLHISQPALSRSIKRLEEELGVVLFDRNNHNICLNRYGQLFLKYAELCLNNYREGKEAIQKFLRNTQNKISIMCPMFYLTGLVFDAFCSVNPNISVEYHLFPYWAIEDALLNKELDFCVTVHPVSDPQIESTLIMPITMGIICPKGHRLEKRSYVTIDELRNENHISFPEDKQTRNDLELLCNNKGFRPNVVFESDSFSAQVQMCKSGKGLIMTSLNATSYIDMNGLDFIPFDNLDTNDHFNLYLLMRKDSVKQFSKYKEAVLDSFRNSHYPNRKTENQHI